MQLGDKVCLRTDAARGNTVNYRIQEFHDDGTITITRCTSCRRPKVVREDEIILYSEAKSIMREAMEAMKQSIADQISK